MRSDSDIERDSRKSPAFHIKSPEHCADLIWRALLGEGTEPDQVVKGLGFRVLKAADFVAGDLAPAAEAVPSDRLLIYAIKQLLARPEFFDPKITIPDMPLPDFDSRAKELIQKQGAGKASLRLGTIGGLLQPSPNEDQYKLSIKALQHGREAVQAGITALVNAWRGGEARSLGREEIFESKALRGPDAIVRLRALLLEGVAENPRAIGRSGGALDIRLDRRGWLAAPDAFGGVEFRLEVALGGADPRQATLRDIRSAVFDPEGRYRIINIYAPGMPGALTALATDLFRPEFRECNLPILYIPLHGRTLAPPRDNYSQLTYDIWTFFRDIANSVEEAGDPELSLDPPEPRGLDQTVELIRATQRLMARHPAIIIFDGYRASRYNTEDREYSLHNLIAAVAGDHLFDLLERLMMVPTPDNDGVIDIAAFTKNRFVILSDKALYEDAGGIGRHTAVHPHPILRLSSGKSIQINAPQISVLPAILKSFGNQAPDQIAWLRTEIGGQSNVDRDGLHEAFEQHSAALSSLLQGSRLANIPVSESIAGVVSVLLMLGDKSVRRLPPSSPTAALTTLLDRDLLPLLERAEPGWLDLLSLIAIAPGGLRPKTLARVYEHLLEAKAGDATKPKRAETNTEIARMLEMCHGIVAVGRSDHLDALQGRPLPLLFRQSFNLDSHEIPTDRAIEFRDDKVRSIFISFAEQKRPGGYLPFLHFLLSEEAYEQSVHLARYDHLQGEDSLHRSARLLTALFHGAASLGNGNLDTPLLYAGAGRFLPDNPTERWVKLYVSAYRKSLDRPPLHYLVRHYDAAQAKLDILLALARPQLCLHPIRPQRGWRLPSLSTEGSVLSDDTLERIRRQFGLELRGAASAVARDLAVDWTSAGLHGTSGWEVRAAIGERILQLTDEHSYENEQEDLGVEILGHIEALFETRLARPYLDFVAQYVASILRGDRRSRLMAPKLERRIAKMAAVPEKGRRELIDYLNLYGEMLGIKADRDFSLAVSNGVATPSPAVLSGFVQSFSAFYIAEYLRNRTFWDMPLSTLDAVNGRAARGYIRVALKLERLRSIEGANQQPVPGGFFWSHAHDVADQLARHLSRFPRERVAMLTLDSAMARYYVSRDSQQYPRFLRMALECLTTAEPLLLKLGLHSRLRHRYALERSKVLAESARLAIEAGDTMLASRYLAIAELDIAAFDEWAEEGNLLWKNLAVSLRRKLAGLRALSK